MTWIVIPCPYHCEILNLAHDNPLTGHLEIKKMYIMAFFWPGLKRDVVHYCTFCHTWQLPGKLNHIIPPAPLYPCWWCVNHINRL